MTDPRIAEEQALIEWLRTAVGELLDITADEVDPDRPLTELGLSSRDGVGLVGELEEHLDRDLDPTLVFETPTITLLVRKLVYGEDAPADEEPVVPPALAFAGRPTADAADDDDAVAIVGLGCRLPGGVHGPRQLWDFLLAGGDGVRQVPKDRWEQFTPPTAAAEAVVQGMNRFGGFLDEISGFDAEFFGISPREAELMDPQQRMLLEVSWEALEHAGIEPSSLRGSATGVYVGMSGNEYSHLTTKHLEKVDAYVSTGSALSIASNRLSYLLDLRGPSMTVDTACSSSLVAMHQAAGSIASGEISTAIVGGVNLVLAPAISFTFDQAGALAPDGRCKSFSADADGIARAEGCGVVVLKRLGDARRDGNHVLSVIRGSAVNQDGRSNGITAPNPLAQEALLRTVYTKTGIDPHSVDYVEAHGTGTLLGDPIEAGALGAVLGGSERDEGSPLLLGSAKTNFGHMEAAAGIVGLIKLVLSLYHDQIPPSLHFTAPNPHIKFDENRISVVTETTDWPRYGGVARGGVSAFGFGGTNAHVILEESGDRNRRGNGLIAGEEEHVTTLVFSAAQESRVRAAAGALAPWLESGAGQAVALRDIAHTLARTRVPGKVRGSVTGRGRAALETGLRALAEGLDHPSVVAPAAAQGKIKNAKGPVWVFSGYGSQWNGMGRRLLEEEPAFAAAIDDLDPLFTDLGGFSLRTAILEDQDPRDVAKAQIALFGMQVALADMWRAQGVEPAAVLGHSMGEVAAAVVSGALSRKDGVRVITKRSEMLQGHNLKGGGGMAVLQFSPEEFEAIAADYPGVGVAVFASPKTITVSGPAEPLNALAEHVKSLDRGAWVLKVSGAGHSEAVDVILDELGEALDGITPGEADVPVYSTVSADPRELAKFDVAYWQANARQPVKFMQAVTAAAADGYTTFLEVSPHPVAEMAVRQTLKADGVTGVVVPTLRRDGDDGVSFRTSLAQLHAWHVTEDLDRVVPMGRKVALPFWQHRRFWIDDTPAEVAAVVVGHPLLGIHIELPEGDRHLWRADIGTAMLPWLRDHRVDGAAVLPASAFAEMALAAASQSFTGAQAPVALTGLQLTGILILGEHTEVTTSLTLLDESSARVDIFTKPEEPGKAMELRASALVSATGTNGHHGGPLVDGYAFHSDAEPIDLYEQFRATGLKHGPAYAGVTDPRLHADGSATARVVLPLAALTDRHYRVHPALIDACIQLLGVASRSLIDPEHATVPYVVDAIGSLDVPGDPQRGGRVTATVAKADDDRLTGAVKLVAEDGTLLLEARDIVIRPVAEGEIPEQPDEPEEGDGVGEGRTAIEALRATDPAAARLLLGQRLLDRVAAVMAHNPEDLDVDAPLTELGFDSLMAVRAKSAVEHDLGIELPVKLLLQGGCLADLEEAIAEQMGLADAGPRRVSLLPRGARYIEPRDATERWIAGIWEDVLGEGPLSATASFDELGGDSTAVDAIIAKMRERLGPELDAAEVFAYRSIEKQADLLREQVEGNGGNPVRVLQAGSNDNPPLFLFHPAGGPTSVYQNLVELLGEGQAVYGMERLEGLRHMEEKAAHYIRMIRDIAPHGPYRLGGWSLGGCLAYEVAQQLRAAGEEIDIVAMIDTTIPKPTPGVTERELLHDRFERFFAYMSETYDIPIDIDLDTLIELDEDEQVELMMNIVKDAGLGMSPGVLEHQRTSYIDARIAERYVPEPYDGHLVLYRATDRGLTTSLDPRYDRVEDALGWDDLVNDLEIVHVPGTHITVIDRPGVRTMADHLRGVLERPSAVGAAPDGAGK